MTIKTLFGSTDRPDNFFSRAIPIVRLWFIVLACTGFFANKALADVQSIGFSELDSYVSSVSSHVYDGNKFGYKALLDETEVTLFHGYEYFITALWSQDSSLFPNKTLVPIAVSDITIFIPAPGNYPISYASPYVERNVIKHQLKQLIERSWIKGYSSSDVQMKSLYDNALAYAKDHQKQLGTVLSETDRSQITADMIWLESHVLRGKSVLVPIVYLTDDTVLENQLDGSTLSFGHANLDYKTVDIDGTDVFVERGFLVNAENDIRLGQTKLTVGNLVLQAGSNIELLSTQISAQQVELSAERITNKTLVTRFSYDHSKVQTITLLDGSVVDASNYNYGYSDSVQQLGFIKSVGGISINAEQDFLNQGASLSSQGDIRIEAGGSIAIVSQPVEEYAYQNGDYWSDKKSSTTHIQSQLSAENIALLANNSILLDAAVLEAEGTIELLAGMGIHLVESVNSISSDEKFEIRSRGLFGGFTSYSEEFEATELLRTVISAGKSIVIRTSVGNIVLRAVRLDTSGQASIVAEAGLVDLQTASTIDYHNYEYYSEDLMVFKTKGYGHYIETGRYNQLVALGGLVIDAGKGIKIEYFSEEEERFEDTINRLAEAPELAWMKAYINDPQVDWVAFQEAHEQWDYEASGLTEVGSIIVAVAVSTVMPGADAFLFSALGNSTIVAASFQAGANVLVTQAATSMVTNGFDPLAAMKDMADNIDVRALVTAMATAGLMDYVGSQSWFKDLTVDNSANGDLFSGAADASNVKDAVTFVGHVQDVAVRAVTQTTVSSGISYLIEGGSLDKLGDSFLTALGQNTVNLIGQKLAQEIGDAKKSLNIETSTQYIAHAALGCVIGTGSSAVANGNFEGVESACASGAGGAAVGEFVAQQIRQDFFDDVNELAQKKEIKREELQAMYHQYKKWGVDMAKLTAALSAHAFGGDIYIAANAGENAAEHNAFWFLAVPAFIALEKAWTVYEYATWAEELGLALQQEDHDKARALLEDKAKEMAIDLTVGQFPGAKVLREMADFIRKHMPNAVEAIEDVVEYASKIDSGNRANILPGGNSSRVTETPPQLEHHIGPKSPVSPSTHTLTEQRLALEKVKNGDIDIKNSASNVKGNFGEMAVDDHMVKKGYTPIHDRVTDINSPTTHGIDHIFEKDGKYFVVESKYGSSTMGDTKDGRQMNKEWIETRVLEMDIPVDIQNAILSNYTPVVAKITDKGAIRYTKLKDTGYAYLGNAGKMIEFGN